MRTGQNIFKRKSGGWEARIKTGYTKTGKLKYKSIYAKTYTEIKAKKVQLEKDKSKITVNKKITFGELVALWLEQKKTEVKQSTISTYVQLLNKHICQSLPVLNFSL